MSVAMKPKSTQGITGNHVMPQMRQPAVARCLDKFKTQKIRNEVHFALNATIMFCCVGVCGENQIQELIFSTSKEVTLNFEERKNCCRVISLFL